jgi:hypothetical protein
MVTKMEVYALEVGDTIVYLGNYYKFLGTSEAPDGTVRVRCQDEEGFLKQISVPDDFATFWIVEESVDA